MTTSCCKCEPMETGPSLGDDTHAVAARPEWAREHGLHMGVVHCVGGFFRLGPSKGAQTRTWAEVNVRPRSRGTFTVDLPPMSVILSQAKIITLWNV